MKTYIGAKIIEAEPDVERDAHGAATPNGRDGYRVRYPDGYVSWSPKDVFEAAYHEVPVDQADTILERMRAATEEPISGYRPLPPETIALINEAKALEKQVGALGVKFRDHPGSSARRNAIAATHIETGFMFLVKSLAAQDG